MDIILNNQYSDVMTNPIQSGVKSTATTTRLIIDNKDIDGYQTPIIDILEKEDKKGHVTVD